MLPVANGKLEPHVPDDVVAKTGTQSHPVFIGIHCHRENQACREGEMREDRGGEEEE